MEQSPQAWQHILRKLVDSLNNDEAFRHWGRALTAVISFETDDFRMTLSLVQGFASESCAPADIRLRSSEAAWEAALNTPYQCGIYDVTERPGMLQMSASPVFIAANAKAMDRLWKHLRCAYHGDTREWNAYV